MQLTYFGHSAFLIETPASRIVIDPFLTDNPGCPDGVTPESLSCDYILLTTGTTTMSATLWPWLDGTARPSWATSRSPSTSPLRA